MKRLLNKCGDIDLKTVENDPEVVAVAFKFFYLPRDRRHQVIVDDGRNYLEKASEAFDLILLDLFFPRRIPGHLCTVEFFNLIKTRLSGKGLLGIHIKGALNGSQSFVFRSIYRTLASVFGEIYLFPSPENSPHHIQDLALFTGKEKSALSPPVTEQRTRLAPGTTGPRFENYARNYYPKPVDTGDAIVFNDNSLPPDGEISLF